MCESSPFVTIACFDEWAPKDTIRAVAGGLGAPIGCDRTSRWHEPGLLLVGTDRPVEVERLEALRRLPGVRRLEQGRSPLDLGARRPGRPRGTIPLGDGAVIGGGKLAVIAGPCSVESEAQICEIAEQVKEAGAAALRGGAFKPRTSPYSFGGLGEEGLNALARARERTGLPIVTEVLDAAHLDLVAGVADVLQIGARNMNNAALLFRAGAHRDGKPILLKRGFAAGVEEFLLAAETVLLGRLWAGVEEDGLILCERGIRTFEDSTRFTLDVAAIPILHDRTRLPVMADPSHAAGRRAWVPALARAAAAAGADGLLVEVHTDPDHAWSDGAQSLDPGEFASLMEELTALDSLPGRVPRPGSSRTPWRELDA